MKIDKHAYKVVEGFKKSLTKQQKKALTPENFEELHILVEAALGSTAELAIHDIAKDIEKLAKKTRKKTKQIDLLEQ
jgi:hypothetical protein